MPHPERESRGRKHEAESEPGTRSRAHHFFSPTRGDRRPPWPHPDEAPGRAHEGDVLLGRHHGALDVLEHLRGLQGHHVATARLGEGIGLEALGLGLGHVDLLVRPGPGLGGVELGLRAHLGDLRLHLGLGDGDVGVALRLDLLELGPLLVGQALLAVLRRELHRDLLVAEGLLVALGVAEVAEQELLHLEAALLETSDEKGLRLPQGLDAQRFVVERFGVHLAQGREHAVAEGVEDEGVDVERAPAELPGDLHGVGDRVEQGDVHGDRVAVGGLDVQRLDHPVGGAAAQQLVAPVEVLGDLLVDAAPHRPRPRVGFLAVVGGLENVQLAGEGVDGGPRAHEIEAGAVGLVHYAHLQAELALLHSPFVGPHPGGTGPVEQRDEHHRPQHPDGETGERRAQERHRPGDSGHFDHQRSPSFARPSRGEAGADDETRAASSRRAASRADSSSGVPSLALAPAASAGSRAAAAVM